DAAELRRRAADRPAAGVHAQRVEDVVFDRLSDLPALFDPRHGDLQRDDLDGHDDASPRLGLAAAEAPAVRAGRRLAPHRRHAHRQLFVAVVSQVSGGKPFAAHARELLAGWASTTWSSRVGDAHPTVIGRRYLARRLVRSSMTRSTTPDSMMLSASALPINSLPPTV